MRCLKNSRLCMVDLAGSERMEKARTAGTALQEGSMINKSLTCLGKVISGLSETSRAKGISHIPYRDSKLTRILKHSLGGNSKTCLILTCSPDVSDCAETSSTLRFGERAKQVKNRPTINVAIPNEQEIELRVYKEYAQRLLEWGLTGIATRRNSSDARACFNLPQFFPTLCKTGLSNNAIDGSILNVYSLPLVRIDRNESTCDMGEEVDLSKPRKVEVCFGLSDWETALNSLPRISDITQNLFSEYLTIPEIVTTSPDSANVVVKIDPVVLQSFQPWINFSKTLKANLSDKNIIEKGASSSGTLLKDAQLQSCSIDSLKKTKASLTHHCICLVKGESYVCSTPQNISTSSSLEATLASFGQTEEAGGWIHVLKKLLTRMSDSLLFLHPNGRGKTSSNNFLQRQLQLVKNGFINTIEQMNTIQRKHDLEQDKIVTLLLEQRQQLLHLLDVSVIHNCELLKLIPTQFKNAE
ncbi:kinesin motor domain-containing protein [Cardiosporidium cionae]|uniref:Kinesin-like protein n=1 Tax=Cardiosporidium cionae TaxID=476202 RepID=A0ABQ7J5B5_9APIC|nr:kinesin motor domain-containing protein [Cardiosporidium cionae]|eukprot:KAF8819200.1 kinesin motor domain-containing protein [Cardiosporidium cionae]